MFCYLRLFFRWLSEFSDTEESIFMNKDEQLKIELNVLLEEYKALKAEIVSNLDSGRQVASLTLTAVGIFISASPAIIQSHLNIVFLIAPLLFYALAWSQLRYTYLVLDMGDYLKKVIVPNVQRVLKETHGTKERDIRYILSWELPGKSPSSLRPTKLLQRLFLPIAGANYGIPLLVAILSVSAFVILAFQNSQTISTVEWIVIAVETIALFGYSAFWGIRAERGR